MLGQAHMLSSKIITTSKFKLGPPIQAQHGRPPGKKEVQYDDKGNVVSVMKIKKFPANR